MLAVVFTISCIDGHCCDYVKIINKSEHNITWVVAINANTGYVVVSKRGDELIAKNSESESFKGNGKLMICVKAENYSELMCAPTLSLYCGMCGKNEGKRDVALVWYGDNDPSWQPHSSLKSSLSSGVKQLENERELDKIRFGVGGALRGFSESPKIEYRIGLFTDISLYTIFAPSGNRTMAFSPEINYAYRTHQHLITVPLLLTDKIFEYGFQFRFPLRTIADRKNIDYEIIYGARLGDDDFFWGIRLGHNFGDFSKKSGFSTFELNANLLF